jgi:hypothetical protein
MGRPSPQQPPRQTGEDIAHLPRDSPRNWPITRNRERFNTVIDYDKMAILDRYGFRFSSRLTFGAYAPQADRPCFHTIPGAFAVWEQGSDIDGWAVVGDDPEELIDLTLDTLSDVPELGTPMTPEELAAWKARMFEPDERLTDLPMIQTDAPKYVYMRRETLPLLKGLPHADT